ncbi:uncharacterized protein LOC143279575 [Babylonia areolata]|uniref:uncharacterized protein LOC143279575 n=1 Tax=Babylonia areolata TaxID=304850 RepID=UPI003FD42AA7
MSNGSVSRSPTSVEPHTTVSAQDLVQGSHTDRCGFLRKRGQKERVLENLHLSRHFNWRQRFVVIMDGCCYCYDDELSKTPFQTFSLEGYNRIYRHQSERATFVFALEPALDCRKKVHNFAAFTEEDRIAWMQSFREAMVKANNLDPSPISSSATDHAAIYAELEKAVYEVVRASPSVAEEDEEDDEEGDSSDDSDYDVPMEPKVEPKTLSNRRNIPLPAVPQSANATSTSPPPTTPTSPLSKPPVSRPKAPLPVAGGDSGGSLGRPKPPLPIPSSPQDTSPLPHLPGRVNVLPSVPAPRPKQPGPGPAPRPSHTPPDPAAAKPPVQRRGRRLSEMDCFFDNNDREAAIEILRSSNLPGTFMIRKSRQGDSRVLVVMTMEDVKEYKIFTEAGQVSLDRRTFFSDVDELLNHYSTSPLPNRQQTLTRSYSNTSH